ncbi:MAG: hypothetical protein R3324_16895, partial [Halobacteriales archaeon]|nr:hypothetical protein [Halobacteriales archaeon]
MCEECGLTLPGLEMPHENTRPEIKGMLAPPDERAALEQLNAASPALPGAPEPDATAEEDAGLGKESSAAETFPRHKSDGKRRAPDIQ